MSTSFEGLEEEKEQGVPTLLRPDTYDRLVSLAKVGETLDDTIVRIMKFYESKSKKG